VLIGQSNPSSMPLVMPALRNTPGTLAIRTSNNLPSNPDLTIRINATAALGRLRSDVLETRHYRCLLKYFWQVRLDTIEFFFNAA
jgi:hypothetical protein